MLEWYVVLLFSTTTWMYLFHIECRSLNCIFKLVSINICALSSIPMLFACFVFCGCVIKVYAKNCFYLAYCRCTEWTSFGCYYFGWPVGVPSHYVYYAASHCCCVALGGWVCEEVAGEGIHRRSYIRAASWWQLVWQYVYFKLLTLFQVFCHIFAFRLLHFVLVVFVFCMIYLTVCQQLILFFWFFWIRFDCFDQMKRLGFVNALWMKYLPEKCWHGSSVSHVPFANSSSGQRLKYLHNCFPPTHFSLI